MDPATASVWGVVTGMLYAAVARRLGRSPTDDARPHAKDFFVVGWYALAASGFLAAAHSSLVWGDVHDLALVATLRLGVVLAFVLAATAFLTAGGYFLTASAGVKSRRPARRLS